MTGNILRPLYKTNILTEKNQANWRIRQKLTKKPKIKNNWILQNFLLLLLIKHLKRTRTSQHETSLLSLWGGHILYKFYEKLISNTVETSSSTPDYRENINTTPKRLQQSHLNNIVFSYLNINSIRNALCDLDKIVEGNIDILCIAKLN